MRTKDEPVNRRSGRGAVYELLQRRLKRRDVLVGSGWLAAAGAVGISPTEARAAVFATIEGSIEDRIVVPDGFASEVLIRWGDPVAAGADGLSVDGIAAGSLLEAGGSAAQSRAFGTSCDGMGVIPVDRDRLVLCINHETPEMSRMFPGWIGALRARRATEFVRKYPEIVAVMRASVGVSVIEIERDGDRWRVVGDSPLNRRITADTPIEFSGPAARHPWLGGREAEVGRCRGTLGNCAAGATPWGTYLTAEENTNDFFGNAGAASFDPLLERATARFGMRRGSSAYRWEVVDERFDHARHPEESMKYGWIVEIDPLDPERPIRKRTALGKLRHEGATAVLNSEDRPVVYMGDDSSFEYFYKFVSDRIYRSGDRRNTDDLLDAGTLYVARLDDDGTGEWLPLVYGEQAALSEANGFASQADVALRCREAADLVGATPLDRPEDVAVHPFNGRIYLSCTQGLERGLTPPGGRRAAADARDPARQAAPAIPGADAANPRAPNPYGHILEFAEAGGDAAAERFTWDVFVLAGDPGAGLAAEAVAGTLTPAAAYYAGLSDAAGLSAFANPDNLGFDGAGNLWIVTDGSQPQGNNNGCFVCPTEGPERGRVRQFMSGPVGAEISGCTFSPDGETLFLTVQHPGGASPVEAPTSHWPDGGDSQPRSSLIAIRSINPSRRFYT
jgi:secreted PhoX family phosphatase